MNDTLKRAIHSVLTKAPADESFRLDHTAKRLANLNLLTKVLDSVRPHLVHLSGDFNEPVDRMSISLYVTILQLADAMKLIASAGPSIAIPTLGRQALDAYVDLHNVLTHRNYWKCLELADDRSWMKALQHASAGQNEYFRSISKAGDLAERRKLFAQSIKNWQKKGVHVPSAKDRFVMAGMKQEYDAVWLMLSAFAHNNPSPLISRTFNLTNGVPQVEVSAREVPYELAAISHTADLLIWASEKIHQRFGRKDLNLSEARKASEELSRLVAENDEN